MMTVENQRLDMFNRHQFILYVEEACFGLLEDGVMIGWGG